MRLKLLALPERGFIEYIPGEWAWRPVDAKGYMFIHCIWVVGKSKGKGYSSILLNECIKDAKDAGMKGVAMVTSERVWLADKRLLVKHGFESVAQAPPAFDLMVNTFNKGAPPSFAGDFERNQKRWGSGLTLFRSDQCPYIESATEIVVDTAKEQGIKHRIVELKSSKDIREKSPSPFGVFNIVYNGKLLSYHYLTKKDLLKKLSS